MKLSSCLLFSEFSQNPNFNAELNCGANRKGTEGDGQAAKKGSQKLGPPPKYRQEHETDRYEGGHSTKNRIGDISVPPHFLASQTVLQYFFPLRHGKVLGFWNVKR
jgi:hypothetical protein